MEHKLLSKHVAGILIFTIGILLSSTLTAALTWASFEAQFYGFQRISTDRFNGLTCPLLLTPLETGLIQMEIENPTDKTINPIVRIDTSSAGTLDSKQTQLTLAPGQKQQFSQTVTADNVDLGFFIFAKAYRYPAYLLPPVESTCGILFMDLPFASGTQIYLLWLILGLIAIPLGLWLWSPMADGKILNAIKAMAVIALAGLLLSVQFGWGPGLLCLVLTLLLSTAVLRLITQK